MRTLISYVLLLVMSVLGNPGAALAQAGDEAAVAQAVESFRKAVLSKDRKQFETLIADQVIYGHSDGRTETKTQYIDDATGQRVKWTSVELANQTIRVTGDTAIVRHNYVGDSERAGAKAPTTRIGVMMVWQKQGGHWKLLARQAYPMKS
jgi:ketosteroid isomerase-like protein